MMLLSANMGIVLIIGQKKHESYNYKIILAM